MTAQECGRVLKEMEATWPRSDRNAWTEQQAAVWLKTLGPLEFEDAMAALDCCREATKFLPSHAEFLEYARGSARRRLDYQEALQRKRVRELTVAPINSFNDAERARMHIAGQGSPRDVEASPEYAAVWMEHLRPRLSRVGKRVPAAEARG